MQKLLDALSVDNVDLYDLCETIPMPVIESSDDPL
jgi:hypothetical protein